MKLLIELDEEYVKVIDKIKFLVGGRTDRKLQLEIIKAIKNGKPIEQEPRKGHWILVERNFDNNDNNRYICSNCYHSDEHSHSTVVDYCWHCGAKMVEPQESEEEDV